MSAAHTPDIETIRHWLIDGGHVRGPDVSYRAALYAAAPELADFIRKWMYVGHLQSFEDRERFRKEGAELLSRAEGRS